MAAIILIRHGQGLDPLHGDYDGLSELGVAQAARLGAGLPREAASGFFHGPLKRQRLTAEHALHAAGIASPALLMPELDEHAGHAVVSRVLADPSGAGPELARFLEQALAPGAPRQALARVVASVVRAWASGKVRVEGTEDFPAFQARVRRALERLVAAASGEGPVVAFTSGGFIGAAVGQVLGLGAEQVVELGLAVDNASVTELRFSRREPGRVGLKRFNVVAHLEGELLTGI